MKRSLSFLTCALLICMLCCGGANAADTRSSDYLRSYNASLSTGSNSGELSLRFSANARSSMVSVGVSKITVYSSDGTFVKTISGSTSNGLLASNTSNHSGTYSISVTSGQSYYLQITFMAKNSSGSDSKTFTTNTATASK